ncbi:Uncharacterised protein [Burkholderia pseudomallei]|nr:alpha-2-macroglobulin family domain protein [Burkholderia pseudomallei]KGD29690.1 alpha-2-macroglobulin family domain protein [Burkholderia pseudomallei]CAJ5860311.1 Uncharacterised protein [Burkholderia pseudomallei]CAK0607417.1 Uncharacterised protein [Burkholderia pseudomallei]
MTSPSALVLPAAISSPLQSDTRTCAFGTGLPLSSVVTQTTLFSRPSFRCTPRFVTSTAVRTYIFAGLASSERPSAGDASSST